MKITCTTDGALLDPEKVGLDPNHIRFEEEQAGTTLTAKIDFEKEETAEFEVYDFTDGSAEYQMDVRRFVTNSDGSTTVIETWERNGTKVTSGEYTQVQDLDLMVTATDTSSSGAPITTVCKIKLVPVGRG